MKQSKEFISCKSQLILSFIPIFTALRVPRETNMILLVPSNKAKPFTAPREGSVFFANQFGDQQKPGREEKSFRDPRKISAKDCGFFVHWKLIGRDSLQPITDHLFYGQR